jgi:hypothetical protein
MIVGQEVMQRTNSPTLCWKLTIKAVIAQTYMWVFLIREVSDTILAMLFHTKQPANHMSNHCGPQFEKHYFRQISKSAAESKFV